MSNDFSLPCSSFDQLQNFIYAYWLAANGSIDRQVSYKEVASHAAVADSTIAGNSKFFTSAHLLNQVKRGEFTITNHAKKIALSHSSNDFELDIRLREWIAEVPFLQKIVSAIDIRKQFEVEKFISYILVNTNSKSTKHNLVGARAVIDILKEARLIEQDGSMLKVVQSHLEKSEDPITQINEPQKTTQNMRVQMDIPTIDEDHPQIIVNINYDYDNSTSSNFIDFLEALDNRSKNAAKTEECDVD